MHNYILASHATTPYNLISREKGTAGLGGCPLPLLAVLLSSSWSSHPHSSCSPPLFKQSFGDTTLILPKESCHIGHSSCTDWSCHHTAAFLCLMPYIFTTLKSWRESCKLLGNFKGGERPGWHFKTQMMFRRNYMLMVQSCLFLVGSTEHQLPGRALL